MSLNGMTRPVHRALALVVAAAIAAIALAVPALAQGDRQFPIERVDRATRTVSIGPSGTIEIKNVSGDVSVTAGTGPNVTVEIVRRSRGRTDADAAQGLAQVHAAVDQQGTRATVVTEYPNMRGERPYNVNVTYTITAPAGTSVTAENTSGGVTVKDLRGQINADVVSGRIAISGAARVGRVKSVSGAITITDVDGDGDLAAATVSGDIHLDRVRAKHIAAEVVSGDIAARDARCDGVQLKSLSGSVEYEGTLSASGRYELQSHSGEVRFLPAGGTGYGVRATTFSGTVVANGVTMQTLTKTRQALEGTVGGGGATVVLTTFAGDVVIGRR